MLQEEQFSATIDVDASGVQFRNRSIVESEGLFCPNPVLHFVTTGMKFVKSSPKICGFIAERGLLQKYYGAFSDSMDFRCSHARIYTHPCLEPVVALFEVINRFAVIVCPRAGRKIAIADLHWFPPHAAVDVQLSPSLVSNEDSTFWSSTMY